MTAGMTDLDKKLIEKAQKLRRWDWRDIDALIAMADTREAKQRLDAIKCDKYDLVQESI